MGWLGELNMSLLVPLLCLLLRGAFVFPALASLIVSSVLSSPGTLIGREKKKKIFSAQLKGCVLAQAGATG